MALWKFSRAILFVLLTSTSQLALAQSAANGAPGSVPLDDSRPPASDIIVNGQKQTRDDLVQMRKQLAKRGLDLSDLQPVQNSTIWKDEISAPLDPQLDKLRLDPTREVQYVDMLRARTSNFRFTVRQTDPNGQTYTYRIMASKNGHAFLLRKNILRKLGYRVPPTLLLPRLDIRFKGDFSKKDFLTNLNTATFADEGRWVINKDDKNTMVLQLQDVIAFEAEDPYYNLANGYLDADEHVQGRRLFNSLIVPYSIVGVQETVEGLSYESGRVFGNYLLLDVEDGTAFSTPREDALWILKRIAQLTREDFKEIVDQAFYPPDVGVLLLNKIMIRRNWLIKNFNLKSYPINVDLAATDRPKTVQTVTWDDVDPSPTVLPDLVKGDLLKETWPGHASRYSYTDPESPLSPIEIRAFFKSKAQSTAIASAVAALDRMFLPGTDIEQKILDKQMQEAKTQFINYLKTGKVQKVPFGFYTFPTIDGSIGVSRDIVTGDYLGADNMIQLADTFEYMIKPGILSSVQGLPAGYQLSVGAEAKISRSYTHLRNIKSIRRALKEPFKNMLVSMLKKETGHLFDELMSGEYAVMTNDERDLYLKKLMSEFNDQMSNGDSFIISDNIGLTEFIGAGYGFAENIALQATLNRSRISIGRLHIMKRGENTIHIYRDHGDVTMTGFTLGLKAYIPIVSFTFNKNSGQGDSKFYSLDLTPNHKANPDIEKNMSALRAVLLDGSLDLADKSGKPYQIHQTFKEKTTGFNLLWMHRFGVEQNTDITIQHPEGATTNFLRATQGSRSGADYQGVAVDTINAIFEKVLDVKDVTVPNPGSGDPGDTFHGHSHMRNAALEVEVANSTNTELAPPFYKVDYRWQGWKTKPKKMLSLIREVNEKFGYEMFEELKFGQTDEFQLYSIDVNVFVYNDAIVRITSASPKVIKDAIMKDGVINFSTSGTQEEADEREYMADDLIKLRDDFVKLYNSDKKADAMKKGLKFLSALEVDLPFQKFVDLVGGPQNVFVYGQVTAFREGNENGDLPIIGNSYGQFTEEKARGGLNQLQSSIGMAPGEFYFYWLLRKL